MNGPSMGPMARRTVLALLAAGCAGPPIAVYTLGTPASTLGPPAPVLGHPTVIEVRRVGVPDFLDTQDLSLRNGNRVERSFTGRWASRLSVGATSYLTARLAQRRPDAVVTDQPQVDPPTYRLYVNISTLDVVAPGTATLEADWLIVPRDPATPTRRDRGRFTATGPVATDEQVVALTQAVMDRLADAIDVASLR